MARKRKTHQDEPIRKENQEERDKWKLLEIVPDSGKYTAYERLDVLQAYFAEGSIRKAAAITGVNEKTITWWIRSSKWWKPAMLELRILADDQFDARMTGIIEKSLDAMEDRLEYGDPYVDKEGDVQRKPVSFRDLSVAGVGVAFDKRQLNRGLPTARIEQVSDTARLEKLADQFARIAAPRTEKVIEGTVIKEEDKD